jgi:hypothetical protein
MNFFYIKIVFRKIADLKRERELAETRKNEGLDQISSDHPVRKLISKFRKISQENRTASQASANASVPPSTTTTTNSSQQLQPKRLSLSVIPETTIEPATAEPSDYSPITNTTSSVQLLQLPFSSTNKQREKLDTISERIESQESQTSQITSVNQSPPLQRPPKSSKWKWLKGGSTEPDSSSKSLGSNLKSQSTTQQQPTNPFDPNLSDDDVQSNLISNNERKLSIPLGLFIPRSARLGNAKTSEDETEDQVKHFIIFEQKFFFFLIRNNWKNLILILLQHLDHIVVYQHNLVIINYYHH